MDFDPKDAAVAGTSIVSSVGAAIALARWSLARNIEAKDKADEKRDKKLEDLESKVNSHENTFARVDPRLNELTKEQGKTESELGRISGKIEGLQTDWRGKFEALQQEINRKHEKLIEMLTDVKSESAKSSTDLRLFLEAYRKDFHDRFSAVTKTVYDMRKEAIDEMLAILKNNKER